MKLFIGNLPFDGTTEETLRPLFEKFGEVHSLKLIDDRDTGRFRGFGFVEMDRQDAQAAMAELNDTSFGGRNLRINEANPPRSGGGGQRRGDDRGNRRERSDTPYGSW